MMDKEKIRIEAIVMSGQQKHYVLNRPLQKTYTKIDDETIIGEDEGALSFYKRAYSIFPFGKTAFGGREFTLQLTDGTVEKCSGQWWDDMSDSAIELFGSTKLADFAWNTVEDLKKCFVFYGGDCEAAWLEKLEAEFNGKVYNYQEYEQMIRVRK